MSPVRIQRQRTKGWRMPEGAVYVGRPTRWGNQWAVRQMRDLWPRYTAFLPNAGAYVVVRLDRHWYPSVGVTLGGYDDAEEATLAAVDLFRRQFLANDLTPDGLNDHEHWLAPLRGRDLACWCPEQCGAPVAIYGVAYGDIYEPCRLPRGHRDPDWHDPTRQPYCHADVLLELANREAAS